MIEDGITIDSPWLDLRRADCMDLMKDFEDNHFDLAIVDPPYGINHSSIAGKQSGQKYGNAAAVKETMRRRTGTAFRLSHAISLS